MKSRWFRPSTIPLMLVILLPLLAPNIDLAIGFRGQYIPTSAAPLIAKVMIGVAIATQIAIAYFASLLFDWTLDAAGKRQWIQLKLRTCIALMVFASLLVYWNLSESGFLSHANTYAPLTLFLRGLGAIGMAVVPLWFVLGLMFLAAFSEATAPQLREGARKIAGQVLPADSGLEPLYPGFRERMVGGIPLILLILLMFVSVTATDAVRADWIKFRVLLSDPSVWIARWHACVIAESWVPFLLAGVLWTIYWRWVSQDHQRIFWFNVVVIALLLFSLLALALGIAMPFLYRSCVSEGSEIETPNGKKRVEDLKVGDAVLGRSSDGELLPAKVTHIRRGISESLIVVKLEGGLVLRVTA